MPRTSAGLLMYRIQSGVVEVLLAHPGGPFFKHKDDGAWTIPKGEPEPSEDLFAAAQREFEEETGITPRGSFTALHPIQQKGGKIVHAWAFEGDCDPAPSTATWWRWSGPPIRAGRSSFRKLIGPHFSISPRRRKKSKPDKTR